MAKLIKRVGKLDLRDPNDDPFSALVRSIMYQQLAGAAATAIHNRFLGLFPKGLSPGAVLALKDGAMRAVGVSGSKQAAIVDLATKVADGTVPLEDADSLTDDDLMFQLHRMDVWPVDDYGVRKGWAMAHRLKEPLTPRALKAEGDQFRPYRSVAAWYCWRAIDG